MDEVTPVDVSYQPIELCKLLKIANMVGGGGEAKIVISEGYVYVNGEVEFQKRKKIYHQDIVEFNGEIIEVQCAEPVLNQQEKKAIKAAKAIKVEQSLRKNQKAQKHQNKKRKTADTKTAEQEMTTGKRKRISF